LHVYTQWCKANCIVVNPSKSNFMLFNADNIDFVINGVKLVKCEVVKYLGVLIDCKLSWGPQVNHTLLSSVVSVLVYLRKCLSASL
jgi:hypothetical protein